MNEALQWIVIAIVIIIIFWRKPPNKGERIETFGPLKR